MTAPIRLKTCHWPPPDWPEFRFDLDGAAAPLSAFPDHAGRVRGANESLPAKENEPNHKAYHQQ